MSNPDGYVASIVEKYRVCPDAGSQSHHAADEIAPLLKQWGNKHLAGITLSGGYAQNTAISLCSDADVLITLSPIPDMEIKNIFWSLFEFLTERNLRAHTRDVSVRVDWKDVKLDLIPSYRIRGGPGTLLFHKRSGSSIETDLARHVQLISKSGRQQEICALKIWRERNRLEFPSLYLELSVLNALESERFGQLADNVLTMLRHIANRFEQTIIRDPANQENIVSKDLSAAEKKAVAKAARDALYDENWKKILR